ncbi:MAG TPA: trypsin-like peptidase domain-containing protein [Jatrophihabitantaceae bacterium]|nr:trypsin-like peptidase domain-containing protein [Jatrophihabitantaceae bacterium]
MSEGSASGEIFARPAGLDAPFAPREDLPAYAPPPPTVSPEDQAVFGRPAGATEFAPAPGERIPPRHAEPPPVPQHLAETYAASPSAAGGFDAPPGARIDPRGREPESPWWKDGAQRDPWRDPRSAFWLGQGAVFSGGRAAQLEPVDDVESDGELAAVVEEEPPPVQPRGRGRFGLSALALTLLVGLVAGGVGGGVGYWLTNRGDHLLHRNDVKLAKTGTPANRPPGSVADIAKRVGPAVVSISVTTPTAFALGSGVVIDKNGYVLTNNHVVATDPGVKTTIVVTFADEATAAAQIVGRDPTSDLAVLKVPTSQLTVASLGDSDKLAVGDPVIAIGSPLGLQGTVTEGIVSSLNRAVHIADASSSGVYINAIQTDAAINHGNSGGALVDASGAVVGINSAAALSTTDANGQQSAASGIGFAIPINYARDVATQLIRSGKAVHASFGAQGHSATANDGLEQGAFLVQITPNGPAAKAGLKVGDVVVVADNKPIESYDQLVVIIQAHKPGDTMTVTYFRGAAKHTATVTLTSA